MKNKVSQSSLSSRRKRLSNQEIQKAVTCLEEKFLCDVKAGIHTLGNPLPSLHQLEEKYGISYHLARQFYSYLEKRGIVLSVRGKGIFLAKLPEEASFLPNQLLFNRGFLVIGVIETNQIASALNSDGRWLAVLEEECLDRKIPFRFLNLCGLEPNKAALRFRDFLEQVKPAGVFFLSPEKLPLSASERRRCPVPFISLGGGSGDGPTVTVDEEESGRLATEYLLKEEYKKIGFLAYPDTFAWQKQRLDGYRSALQAAGLSLGFKRIERVEHKLTNDLHFFREKVFRTAEKLFPQCDAILCGSDILGVLLLEYAREKGISPTERPALVGFDNQFEWRGRELSSVSPAHELQAREALRLLMEWCLSPSSKRSSVKLPGRLYIRNSSFKPEERE